MRPQRHKNFPNQNRLSKISLLEDEDAFNKRYSIIGLSGESRCANNAVLSAIDTETGMKVAVKLLNKTATLDVIPIVGAGFLPREFAILDGVDHPMLLHAEKAYEGSQYFYMVFDTFQALQVDLFSYIDNLCEPAPESIIRWFFLQIIDAVSACRSYNLIHCDIKDTNIMVESNTLRIKLIDFGHAMHRDLPALSGTSYTGTPEYAAPEVISGRPLSVESVESWSLGWLLYVITYGVVPFRSRSDTVYGVINRTANMRRVSVELDHLLGALLNPDPRLRPTLGVIRHHPWVLVGPHSVCI